jgi:putative ABC transport system substrate-binding protein
VIVTASTPAAQAAKNATNAIPIVMATGGDPVGAGLIASLGRPGGNVTGMTHLAGPEMQQKLLEFLKEIAPPVARLGIITNRTITPEISSLNAMEAPARALGLTLVIVDVRHPDQFDAAFVSIIRDRIDAVLAFESPMNTANRRRIVDFATQHRMPTVFGVRAFVDAGGLISYGTDFPDLFRRAATFVDKILKGAKPSDLPVEQPTKFELVINLKTAKALGLTIPPSLLLRVDQVIE